MAKGRIKKTSPKKKAQELDEARQIKLALELKALAWSNAEIAAHPDITMSRATVQRRVAAELAKRVEEIGSLADELRLKFHNRYEAIVKAHAPMALGLEGYSDEDTVEVDGRDVVVHKTKANRYKATEVVMKATDAQRKLWGVDAPVKTDITSDGEKLDAGGLLDAICSRITGE